ncbi:MAG: uracil-DNA glycosylase [Chloroflexi bacterium]|nr:MAG: uracil-DNA glycosylase [Chloroflexota bacterium]HDN79218.1 uracil-DNA glycosylase [Chloroflexota bacterium]
MTELEKLYEEIRNCHKCRLAESRTNAVPGEGPEDAQIMFIGEAPGFHEDRQGRPFVGAAGRFLDQLLESIGIKREEVYICNVIKCRPPGNRDPLADEIKACAPYLDRQIEIIKPRLIVTLGRFSLAKFLPKASISKVHGQLIRVGDLTCYPVFHPAAALHQPRWKSAVEEDFRRIPEILKQLDKLEIEDETKAKQLSLFGL